MLPNNSLQLTRLACGKFELVLPAGMSENEWAAARGAEQLSSAVRQPGVALRIVVPTPGITLSERS